MIKSNGVPSYNTIKDQDKDNSQEDSDEYIKQLRERLSESMQDENLSDETKKKLIERSNPGFWAVKTMTSGESFGEVALSKDLDGYKNIIKWG